MNKLLATALVSIGIAAAVPAAYSQTAAPADGGRGQFAQRQGERAPRMTPSERMEARLAYVRTALKITATQQPQWDAYANVLRKHAAAMDKRFQERRAQMEQRPAEARRATVVERHERMRERMVASTQRLDELLTVEKPLYAALSPDQQRVADEVLGSRGGGRHGGGFHHRGGRYGRA